MTTYHLPICYCLLSILHCIYIHICLSLYTYMLKTLKVWTVVCPPPSPPLFMQHSHFLKTWKPLPHPPNTIWGRGESSFSPLWVEVTHQLQESYRNRGCWCLPLPPPHPSGNNQGEMNTSDYPFLYIWARLKNLKWKLSKNPRSLLHNQLQTWAMLQGSLYLENKLIWPT